jgi:hypothetical protein
MTPEQTTSTNSTKTSLWAKAGELILGLVLAAIISAFVGSWSSSYQSGQRDTQIQSRITNSEQDIVELKVDVKSIQNSLPVQMARLEAKLDILIGERKK